MSALNLYWPFHKAFKRPMGFIHQWMILSAFLGVIFPHQSNSQSPNASATDARSLDALLQDYAYRGLVHPRTGVPYDGVAPSNLTGIKIAALRLKSGSLYKRGVEGYKEFRLPPGVFVQPYVERLVLVYQNLGNWSSFYYPLPGYTYLTPVLGLLAYDAANLSATNLPELDLVAAQLPVSVGFSHVNPVPSGSIAKCVWFDLEGSADFRVMETRNNCLTFRQGHFSIVVNSSEVSSSPDHPIHAGSKSSKSKIWRVVGWIVEGVVVFVILAVIVALMRRHKKNQKLAQMEQFADAQVSLQRIRVGNAQLPVASEMRTQPVLENDLVP
ncbi:hypothetical protein Cni_G05448 [Canna indica]|uniref:Transmembrane protein n=1 Tax=Canna indica TaxID=4628 RepID=A0AAQ3JV89_9LILI|nr:hypothetical protein Cni_G05448 [Canna indica]